MACRFRELGRFGRSNTNSVGYPSALPALADL